MPPHTRTWSGLASERRAHWTIQSEPADGFSNPAGPELSIAPCLVTARNASGAG
jgi:hypothetical protein